ncbi:esterase-like activity of phytase family protein [Hymenobacter sp. NST-14]|uniref:esterase-like activity of phytase family protein n=1 Tax=Hymenobacter piscis TaxID=2839984 RepID=UPI001C021CDB|nr:esterase-like activity of phytase family protein [Hymenobacter piscis]MBT9394005.1 esterase-like activity of phytase family protein [Hymenobacter piscis]
MRHLFFTAVLAATLCSSCSEAQTTPNADQSATDSGQQGGKKEKKGKKKKGGDIANLTKVARLDNVPESSGLALADQPGTFYTHGDDGNPAILYKISATTGQILSQIDVPVKSRDWESITRDNSGNVYIGDVGNNNNDRQNLVIHRLNPLNPQIVQEINLKYPDQREFPPQKDERNFDCEATLWHEGQVYLFTKDRAREQTSKVYTVPDQAGSYTAKLLTKLAIPGQVTDAALSPDGRRLVLLARQEMFVFEGSSLAEILRATPRRISLKGAGQTEGAVFTSNQTLYISSEQGDLYQYLFE